MFINNHLNTLTSHGIHKNKLCLYEVNTVFRKLYKAKLYCNTHSFILVRYRSHEQKHIQSCDEWACTNKKLGKSSVKSHLQSVAQIDLFYLKRCIYL